MNYKQLIDLHPEFTDISEIVIQRLHQIGMRVCIDASGQIQFMKYNEILYHSKNLKILSMEVVDLYDVSRVLEHNNTIVTEMMTASELAKFTKGIFTQFLCGIGDEAIFTIGSAGFYEGCITSNKNVEGSDLLVRKLKGNIVYHVVST